MPIQAIKIPDATAFPVEYKQALLDLIGTRDPLEVAEQTTAAVRALCDGQPVDVLEQEPAPEEWSAAFVVGHLFDVDVVYGFRWRLVLTEEFPTYPGYEEKRWTGLPRLPFWQTLTAWEGLRAANLHLLRATPREQWELRGNHGQQGPETFDEMVRKVAAHDLAHINQIARAIEALAPASSGA